MSAKQEQAAAQRARTGKEQTHDIGASTDQNQQAQSQTHRPDNQSPDWYSALIHTNLGLIIVATFTFLIIGWQAVETKKAAQASRDSVQQAERHFRVLHRQWIDVSEFHFSIAHFEDEDAIVLLSFKLSNNTELPLRLSHVKIYVFDSFRIIWFNQTLATRDSRRVTSIAAKIPVDLTRQMQGGGISIVVAGIAFFSSALDDMDERTLSQSMFARVTEAPMPGAYGVSGSLGVYSFGSVEDLIKRLELANQRDSSQDVHGSVEIGEAD